MRLQLFSLGVASLLAASLFSLPAQANSRGISGRSGKPGQTNSTCAFCHTGGAGNTTVELRGPNMLEAGATGDYSLVIRGGPAVKGGMNVSTSAGSLIAGADTKILAFDGQNELTHKDAPKNFVTGTNEVTFAFSLMAPATGGTVTLYASGNSVNGNNAQVGDDPAQTTMTITVTGGSGNPDAGTGDPDAGTTDPGDGDEDKDKGCSATGGAPMVLLLALAAAYLRRRTV
jgi:uncharacterized protein (TIGR03382 family)